MRTNQAPVPLEKPVTKDRWNATRFLWGGDRLESNPKRRTGRGASIVK